MKKLKIYAEDKIIFNIVSTTRKIKSLFRNKDKVRYLSCIIIYEGNYSCGSNYIGEIIKNSRTRFKEHEITECKRKN